MSSSEESSADESYTLYKDRPEWRDVIPTDPEDDFPHQVVRIAYSPEFKDCFDYFRAIIEKGELSQRAFQLTTDCIKQNPANYTVWEYRRQIIKALNIELDSEFAWTSSIIARNIKNFQVWHHRQMICKMANNGNNEIPLVNTILMKDEKNYHAWQHRQWAIKTYSMYSGEMDLVDQFLTKDIYNNSAWNHRYFIINNTSGWTKDVIDNEIDFTISKIKYAIDNESVWNYLRAIIKHDLLEYEKVVCFVTDLWEENKKCDNGQRIRHLAAFNVDMLAQQAKKDKSKCPDSKSQAIGILKMLIEDLDPIRTNYWNYQMRMIADIQC